MSAFEATTTNQEKFFQLLENEEVINSLQTTLEKLPSLLEHFSAIEKTMNSLREVSKYRATMTDIVGEFSSQFSEVTIGSETFEAIATLINKLPKIAEYITVLEQFLDIAQTVISDKKTMEFMMNGVKSLTEPVQAKIKDGISIVQDGISIVEEAKERAKADKTNMSIFSIIGLLKDPKIQDGLRFIKAFLTVLSEHDHKAVNGSKQALK